MIVTPARVRGWFFGLAAGWVVAVIVWHGWQAGAQPAETPASGLAITSALLRSPPVLARTWTNRVQQIMQVISVQHVDTPCPECGQVNHHSRQVVLQADYDKVYTEIVYQGRTNQLLVGSTVVTNYLATNYLFQAWNRGGAAPALPVSTNTAAGR